MKCKNCGKEIDKSWKFCRYCGTEVQGETQTPRAGSSRIPGKWMLLLMAMLALVVGAFFVWRMGQKESEQLNQEQPIQLSEQHYQENQEQSVQSNQEYPIHLSEQSIQFDNGDVVYRPEAEHLAYDASAAVDYYDNLLFVYLLHNLDAEEKTTLAKKVDGVVVGNISGAINAIQIQVNPTDLIKLNSCCDLLMESEHVLYASYEYPVPMGTSDVKDENPWSDGSKITDKNSGIPDGNDWWAEAIDAYKAWDYVDRHPADVSDITVGIIDNGFNIRHEDLIHKSTMLDGFEHNSEGDHGTHVAGIIGAKNNNIGIRGVADRANLLLADFTLFNEVWSSGYNELELLYEHNEYNLLNNGTYVEITKQMIESGAKVINNSWGYGLKTKEWLAEHGLEVEEYSSYLNWVNVFSRRSAAMCILMMTEFAINGFRDYLIVESAGNGYKYGHIGHDASLCGNYCSVTRENYNALSEKTQNKLHQAGFSYDYFHDRILIVGAVKNEKSYSQFYLTDFSNYGPVVDICAPGDKVFSTLSLIDEQEDDSENNNGKLYGNMRGTSMAAPMVSGAAALVWSVNPELTAPEVKGILVSCLRDGALGVGDDAGSTYPMLNVGMAVKKAAAMKTSGYCGGEGDGTNCTWNFDKDTGTLTISGTGLMADWSHKEDETAPWFSWCEEIKTVKIEDGVTNIGKYAFYDCSRMTKAEMADSVLTIGEAAFSACNDMTEIKMSANLSAIESRAFNSCFSLPHIVLPGSLKKIGNDAFVHCRSLDNIQLPLGIQTINIETFYACSSLSGMTLPNSIITLSGTFAECTGLKWLSLPENFSKLGYMALYKCDGLTDIYFAGSEEQWKQVYISKDNNDTLKHVTIHFGITAAAPTPAPEDAETGSITGEGADRDYLLVYKPLIEKILEERGVSGEDTTFGKLADLNDDGTDELLVVYNDFGYHAFSVYSVENNALRIIAENRSADSDNFEISVSNYRGNKALIIRTWGAGSSAKAEKYQILTGLTLKETASFSATRGFRDDAGSYFYVNGSKATEAQYQNEVACIGVIDDPGAPVYKRAAWMRLIDLYNALFPQYSGEQSYVPIMERVLAASVKDDAHGLLYDVNGDGVDELLLLYKEDSQGYPILIEAYTKRNGEAVAVLEKDKLNQDIGAERGAFGVAEYAGNKYLCRYFTSGFNGPGTWTREKITLYDALTGEPAVRFEAGKFYELGTGSVTKTSYVFNGNSVSEQEYGEQYDQIVLDKMIDREDAQYSLRSLLESAK